MKKLVIAAVAMLVKKTEDDYFVILAVDEAEELILNYINRKTMPAGCKHIWVSLSADIYKLHQEEMEYYEAPDEGGSAPPTFEALENVSAVKIDDAEVRDDITAAKYQADKSSKGRQNVDDLLKNYYARLHKFRLMSWRPVAGQ